jgi:4-hydroxy-3-polyprenylbenzoate decarboxylase
MHLHIPYYPFSGGERLGVYPINPYSSTRPGVDEEAVHSSKGRRPGVDLREFLGALEERGLLRRVRSPLSPVLEIPVALRAAARAGLALLFENVRGYEGWRVAGNLFASMESVRVALSAGDRALEELGWRLVSLAWRQPPEGLVGKLRSLADIASLGRYAPRTVGRAAFEDEVVEGERVDVTGMPHFKCWPRDGGRYITFGQVYTVEPGSGVQNVGVYRVMVRGSRELVVHWQQHRRGRKAYIEAVERGERLPVAIAIGSDPAAMLAAVMPVPYPMDKLFFAGVLAGRSIEVYRLPNGVKVPATAEVVLEGYVEPGRLAEEGPFGDHWGYYDKPHEKFPVMTVERIWMRHSPIYVGTCVGKPFLEDATIGKAVERIFLPILKTLLPELVDINLPREGAFHGIAIVSIRKMYPGHAKKVMMALWGLGQLSLTKTIIVVDHDVDVHDLGQVLWAVAANVDPQRDVLVAPATHTDQLDPAAPIPGFGSKLGIDATRKLPEENNGRPWPEPLEEDPEVVERVRKLLEQEGLNLPPG